MLEDDVLFTDNFTEIFNKNLESTPEGGTTFFPVVDYDLRVPKAKLEEGKIAYLKNHPATKCTDSIIIKLDAAKNIKNL